MVNAPALGEAGRRVRCASCGHIWHQAADAAALEAAEMAEPIPESVRPVPKGSALPAAIDVRTAAEGADAPPSFAYVCFILIFLSLSMVALLKRDAIVLAWEPAARIFSAISFPVPVAGEGLVFSDSRAFERKDPKDHVIYIEASVKNKTALDIVLPAVDVTILGHEGVLDTRHYLSQGRVIPAGELQPFRIPVSKPPEGGDAVILTFSAGAEAIKKTGGGQHGH